MFLKKIGELSGGRFPHSISSGSSKQPHKSGENKPCSFRKQSTRNLQFTHRDINRNRTLIPDFSTMGVALGHRFQSSAGAFQDQTPNEPWATKSGSSRASARVSTTQIRFLRRDCRRRDVHTPQIKRIFAFD